MSEKVDVNKKIDEAEAAVKKYASKDTVISIGGYEFTPAKLMVAFTLLSSILGGLYGVFEVYKDYVGMKKKIAEYVSPDLSGYDKRMAIFESKLTESVDIVRDIRTDLRTEIGKQADQIAKMDGRSRDIEREVRGTMTGAERDVKNLISNADKRWDDKLYRVDTKIDELEKKLDNKIQKALENPLSNMTTTK
jgi:prefoldin subunit 5